MTATEVLQRELPAGRVAGTYDERFAPVVEEFVRNFDERGEVGASLCLTVDGAPQGWTTTALTMPNMPASDSTWLRMWQCHTHVPTWSAWNSTL